MKIIKTASGKKIKISKREWQDIGKKAGWHKSAEVSNSSSIQALIEGAKRINEDIRTMIMDLYGTYIENQSTATISDFHVNSFIQFAMSIKAMIGNFPRVILLYGNTIRANEIVNILSGELGDDAVWPYTITVYNDIVGIENATEYGRRSDDFKIQILIAENIEEIPPALLERVDFVEEV